MENYLYDDPLWQTSYKPSRTEIFDALYDPDTSGDWDRRIFEIANKKDINEVRESSSGTFGTLDELRERL